MVTPDPADKLDAQADGAFSGAPVNRRAGYGNRLEMALRMARKGGTLMAGEGLLIVEHYEAQLPLYPLLCELLARAQQDWAHPTLMSRHALHEVVKQIHARYTSETPSTEV